MEYEVSQQENRAKILAQGLKQFFDMNWIVLDASQGKPAYPLHFAVARNHFAAAVYLISNGADPNCEIIEGK